MNDKQVAKIIRRLDKKITWLSTCTQRLDVTDIGEQYDLKHLLTDKTKEKKPTIQIDSNKQENTTDSKAIESLKQKIAELNRSGRIKEITTKKNKDKDLER